MPKPKVTMNPVTPASRFARPQTLTELPSSLREYFAERGRNVILASSNPNLAVQVSVIGWDMLFLEDIEGDARERIRRDLARLQFQVAPDGSVRRADAAIYTQLEADRAYHEEESLLQAMRNAGAVSAERDEALEKISRVSGSPLVSAKETVNTIVG
jgi:hypothetical protein